MVAFLSSNRKGTHVIIPEREGAPFDIEVPEDSRIGAYTETRAR